MKNSIGYRIVGHTICIIASFLFLYPLILMFTKSLGKDGISNYKRVFDKVQIWPNFATSLYVVGGTLILVAIVTSLAAFAFSKITFSGKSALYYMLLTGMMIPTAAILFPLFQVVKGLGINNTPLSLILPYVTLNSVFNLMVLKNFYDGLPNELMEAAHIDGAGYWRIFFSIMLPLSIPGLSIVLIQTFLLAWNELQMAMTFINNTAIQPISVVPLRFVQQAGGTKFPLGVMYACLVVCLSPILFFYIAAQKLLIQGLTQGAVKG